MAKILTTVKTIEYCSQCPYCQVVNDPDPNDWFEDDNMATLCNHPNYIPDKRHIDSHEANNTLLNQTHTALRPYELCKWDKVPENCPL